MTSTDIKIIIGLFDLFRSFFKIIAKGLLFLVLLSGALPFLGVGLPIAPVVLPLLTLARRHRGGKGVAHVVLNPDGVGINHGVHGLTININIFASDNFVGTNSGVAHGMVENDRRAHSGDSVAARALAFFAKEAIGGTFGVARYAVGAIGVGRVRDAHAARRLREDLVQSALRRLVFSLIIDFQNLISLVIAHLEGGSGGHKKGEFHHD